MSFYDSTNNMQSGQSFTLEVHKKGPETTVSCPSVPEVEPVVDTDGRYAVQEMKRRLDNHIHQGSQSGRSPMILAGSESEP